MRFIVLATSHREPSATSRVALKIQCSLSGQACVDQVDLADLAQLQFPLFRPDAAPNIKLAHRAFFESVRDADGLVLVTPEWDGMASPAAKNLLMYLHDGEIAHKPGLLVSVSSGVNGAYPIAELRATGSKNSFVNWIPLHLIFRTQAADDISVDTSRIPQYGATLAAFTEYCAALRPVRARICGLMADFPFGM